MEPAAGFVRSYLWEPPEKRLAVRLDLVVVDRILLEVMRGFGAIPRRGAEVGGILLGTIERGDRVVVEVDDFEPVPSEHKRGPSYLLSDADIRRWEEVLARWRPTPDRKMYAVGFFRSHTRDGLALSPEDIEFFDKYFPGPDDVCLLVKPYATRVSVGGFFFREEDGTIRAEATPLEFPFRRRELGGGSPPERPRGLATEPLDLPDTRTPSYSSARVDGPPPEEKRAAAAPKEKDSTPLPSFLREAEPPIAEFRKRNVWIPLSFIFLLLGVVIGFQVAVTYRTGRATGLLQEPFKISLSAEKNGDNLHVTWDRQSPAVREGQRGVLTILDGSYTTKVDLDWTQLRNPSVFYRHTSPNVRLELAIITRNKTTLTEALDWKQ